MHPVFPYSRDEFVSARLQLLGQQWAILVSTQCLDVTEIKLTGLFVYPQLMVPRGRW
jgi:hypothetical protein